MSKNFKMMYALAILLKEFQLGMKILQTCITTKYNVHTFLLLDTYLYAVAVAGLLSAFQMSFLEFFHCKATHKKCIIGDFIFFNPLYTSVHWNYKGIDPVFTILWEEGLNIKI